MQDSGQKEGLRLPWQTLHKACGHRLRECPCQAVHSGEPGLVSGSVPDSTQNPTLELLRGTALWRCPRGSAGSAVAGTLFLLRGWERVSCFQQATASDQLCILAPLIQQLFPFLRPQQWPVQQAADGVWGCHCH